MANMEQIEQELREYVIQSENLNPQDRFIYLKAIFTKHFEIEKTEHLLTMHDFHDIVSYAKSQFIKTTLPVKITRREVYPSEVSHVLLIESILTYLNKSKVLKRLVKIDYTK